MGGAERIITTICNHLPREKFQPSLLLFEKVGEYLDFLKEDVEIIEANTKSIRSSLLPILKTIRQRKPDIVFCGWGEISAFVSPFIPFFSKAKFISRETNVVSKHVTRKEIRFFYRFYNNFHQIITQSDDMTNDLIENFKIKKEKIFKINNPVDFDFINEKLLISEKPEGFDTEFKNVLAIGNLSSRKGFDMEFKNVLAIGNLSSRKGFDNLLKVFSFLKNEKIKLHILGDGADRELLHQMKQDMQLENVIFHGQQKNPYQYLKFSDLFILSSRYEGFPNVLLEAGACGVYALANDCPGGIREIVEEGINGEISDINEHQQFAEKIKEVLSTQKAEKNLIINSIKNRFSKEIILGKYEEILLKTSN